MALVIGWVIMAIVLYYMRPTRRAEGDMKPDSNGRGNNGGGNQGPSPVL